MDVAKLEEIEHQKAFSRILPIDVALSGNTDLSAGARR